VMEAILADRLAGLDWPAETRLAFEISLDGSTVFIDVEFPAIDVVPAREAGVALRGLRIRYNDLSEAQVRRAYAWHIHAILFRLTGETFMTLPAVERVVISGCADRGAPSNGVADPEQPRDFLISAEVERADWARIDFAHLPALDLLAAFERF